MSILRQGSKYDESEATEDSEEVLDNSKKKKVSPKMIIVAVVIILVGIAIIYTMGNLGGDTSSDGDKAPVEQEGEQGDDITDLNLNTFTEDQVSQLRDAGYTGTEIEDFQNTGQAFDTVLAQAKADREAYLEKTYVELRDGKTAQDSVELQQLKQLTWLAGTPNDPGYIAEDASLTLDTITFNASYKKIPARGIQLLVRLNIEGNYVFYNVSPDAYSRLEDEGNMVIKYTQTTINGKSYVTGIEEVPIDCM